ILYGFVERFQRRAGIFAAAQKHYSFHRILLIAAPYFAEARAKRLAYLRDVFNANRSSVHILYNNRLNVLRTVHQAKSAHEKSLRAFFDDVAAHIVVVASYGAEDVL